jgi:hypothetical protein
MDPRIGRLTVAAVATIPARLADCLRKRLRELDIAPQLMIDSLKSFN